MGLKPKPWTFWANHFFTLFIFYFEHSVLAAFLVLLRQNARCPRLKQQRFIRLALCRAVSPSLAGSEAGQLHRGGDFMVGRTQQRQGFSH